MRERGVQSRRVRPGQVEPHRRPGPPPSPRPGGNFWQVLAIVALVAATAGWTTVAVLALRPTPSAQAEVPVESFDPEATDETEIPPVADTHDAVELESLLPATLSGTTLQVQSWDGEGLLTDDPWSTSMTSFLTAACKLPADLRVAQSYDPNQGLDASVGVYHVDGVDPTALRDALIAAWKGDYPDMTVSQVTIGGKDVTKGEFGEDTITSYLYIQGDKVYDIETSDEAVATAALAGLPAPDASTAPVASGSSVPAASCVPPSAPPDPSASPSAGQGRLRASWDSLNPRSAARDGGPPAQRLRFSGSGAAWPGGGAGRSARGVPGSPPRAWGPRPHGGGPVRS